MADPHCFPVRVYYEDTDFSGNVYHAAYLKFLERGRSEWLRDLGVHHAELATQGLAFAVTHMQIDFLGAAHIDDSLEISTEVTGHSGARVKLFQSASRDGKRLCEAKVEIVTIRNDGRPTRLPEALIRHLKS